MNSLYGIKLASTNAVPAIDHTHTHANTQAARRAPPCLQMHVQARFQPNAQMKERMDVSTRDCMAIKHGFIEAHVGKQAGSALITFSLQPHGSAH
eukprot:1108784-Pelagomonas_calceolata.AAC.3